MPDETIQLTPEQREAFRRAGKRGGLAYAAKNDVRAATAHASAAQEAAWKYGHGCSVCGTYIAIPASLEPAERKRRAAALKKRHYTLLAMRRHGR